MASQLTIESPNFDRIRKLDGRAIEDAVRLLWFVANNAADVERRDIEIARNSINNAILYSAPAAAQHNFDLKDAGIVTFTGATAFDLTGVRNGSEGAIRLLVNLGAGTITVKHESASSDAANRINTSTGADVSVTTAKSVLLAYCNSRWREVKPA